jgi:hypothetical protein
MGSRKVIQLVAFVLVVAGVVFVASLVWNSLGRTKGEPSGSESKAERKLIKLDETPQMPDQFVFGEEDCTHDFWFENDSEGGAEDVEVGVNTMKTCTCSKLEIGLAPENWKEQFTDWKSVPREERPKYQADVDWRPLDKEIPEKGTPPRTFTVPPHRAGWLRVHWKGIASVPAQFQMKEFHADLWARTAKAAGKEIMVQTMALFVSDVFMETKGGADADSYDMKVNITEPLAQDDEVPVDVLFWSSRLDSFDWKDYIQKPIEKHNVVWTDPVPLTKDELAEIKKRSIPRIPKCGYRLHFRLKDLPFGRFHETLQLLRHGENRVVVTGRVAGPVRVIVTDLSKPSDAIVLESLSRTRLLQDNYYQEVLLEVDSGVGLQLDTEQTKVPDFIKLEGPMKKEGAERWRIIVRISREKPPVLGKFGDMGESFVVLKVTRPGKPEQSMRILLTGDVTQ